MGDVSKILIARASMFLAEAVNGSVQFTLEGVDVAVHPGDTEQAVLSKMGGTQVPLPLVPDDIRTQAQRQWIGRPDPGYKGETVSQFDGTPMMNPTSWSDT